MKFLGRAEFCLLTGLEVEAFNSLRRRDQLPQRAPRELSDDEADARGYTPLQAFALMVSLAFAEQFEIGRDMASKIAASSVVCVQRAKDILKSSAEIAAGKRPSVEILYAAIDQPEAKPKGRMFAVACGTIADIAVAHPNMTSMVAVSATRIVALMRKRAEKHGIDLGTFWEDM